MKTLESIREDLATAVNGINVAGYLTSESGVGAAARGYVAAIREAGLEVALNNFDVAVQSRKEDATFTAFASNNPYPVNLVCVNADQVPTFVAKFGEEYFRGKYNIGVWWWELPDFPEEWMESFARFDEIWVGSTFIQQSLAKISPVPVVRIPPVVKAEQTEVYTRDDFGLKNDEFLFLFMFDSLSSSERKNPLAVIQAFRQAFQPDEKVRLVLKCINMEGDKAQALIESFADANITLINKYLSSSENLGLISVCDSYVSLHRSEGLGLPLAEAMLLRKPAIATAWSGNMDFMSVANGHLVSYKLKLNEEQVGPYKIGESWAEPDVKHAAALMREVFDGKDAMDERCARAVTDVEAQFSAASVADLVRSRMRSVRAYRPNLGESQVSAKKDYHLDEGVKNQLDIIENGGTMGGEQNSAEQSKSLIRRVFMPILERTGYLSSIYAHLIRRLFVDAARTKTQVDIIDARTRKSLADADRRIRELEDTVAELKKTR